MRMQGRHRHHTHPPLNRTRPGADAKPWQRGGAHLVALLLQGLHLLGLECGHGNALHTVPKLPAARVGRGAGGRAAGDL